MNSADRIILPAVVIGFTAFCAITVNAQMPTRTTLDGVYSDRQASEGQALYDAKCATCHGPEGDGSGGAPGLANDSFTADWDGLTLAQMVNRIRTSMPQDSPGSLTRPQTSAITAYLLKVNHFASGTDTLPSEADALSGITFVAVKSPVTNVQPSVDAAFSGTWELNVSKSTLPADFGYRMITLQFAVVLDTVTIGTSFIERSGRVQRATELFHMDGSLHPGTIGPGVMIGARMTASTVIETSGNMGGQDIGRVTYEVSPDQRTLTSRASTNPSQVLLFEPR